MREILEAESKAVLNIPVTDAYEQAVKAGYKFGCFGDAMLIVDD